MGRKAFVIIVLLVAVTVGQVLGSEEVPRPKEHPLGGAGYAIEAITRQMIRDELLASLRSVSDQSGNCRPTNGCRESLTIYFSVLY